MAYETVILEKERYIATLVMNRPERMNAFNNLMYEEMWGAFEQIKKDPEVRVLVITGAGKAFSTGADVKERFARRIEDRKKGGEEDRAERISWATGGVVDSIQQIRDMNKPIIASINGLALGWGCSLALNCDMRIASEEAGMGLLYIRMGLVPDSGSTYFLPRLVGLGKAYELILSGKIIDAKEAKEIGLVNHVVPAEELKRATYELADSIAMNPPIAVQMAKRALQQSGDVDLRTQIQYEAFATNFGFTTEDHEEAVNAFREKRKPVFRGR